MCVNRHFHAVVWAADDKAEAGYIGVTYVDVIVATPEEAIKRTKQLVPSRKHYRLNNLIEHHGDEDK